MWQIKAFPALMARLGINTLGVPGFEADDVVGSLCAQFDPARGVVGMVPTGTASNTSSQHDFSLPDHKSDALVRLYLSRQLNEAGFESDMLQLYQQFGYTPDQLQIPRITASSNPLQDAAEAAQRSFQPRPIFNNLFHSPLLTTNPSELADGVNSVDLRLGKVRVDAAQLASDKRNVDGWEIDKAYILTYDKDLYQLASDKVSILRPETGTTTYSIITPDAVKAKYGVTPEQFTDYLAFVGDRSDNIPGVRGIGPRSAVTLLSSYGSGEQAFKSVADAYGLKNKYPDEAAFLKDLEASIAVSPMAVFRPETWLTQKEAECLAEMRAALSETEAPTKKRGSRKKASVQDTVETIENAEARPSPPITKVLASKLIPQSASFWFSRVLVKIQTRLPHMPSVDLLKFSGLDEVEGPKALRELGMTALADRVAASRVLSAPRKTRSYSPEGSAMTSSIAKRTAKKAQNGHMTEEEKEQTPLTTSEVNINSHMTSDKTEPGTTLKQVDVELEEKLPLRPRIRKGKIVRTVKSPTPPPSQAAAANSVHADVIFE